jgi:hypothetical protein
MRTIQLILWIPVDLIGWVVRRLRPRRADTRLESLRGLGL